MAHNVPVLVIDDEVSILQFLERSLTLMGFAAVCAKTGEEGLALYAKGIYSVVLIDLKLPGIDGIEVMRRLKTQDRDVVAVVITAYGAVDTAVAAIKAGAMDYLTKPINMNHLEMILQKAMAQRHQAERLHLLETQVEKQGAFEGLVGVSPQMQGLYRTIKQVAQSDATVLIEGETGTGKEVVARAIHNLSERKGFVPIHCGALPEGTLESELFGHEKGAFTGAIDSKPGLIEGADGGTLFLDEIETMTPAVQVKFLRVLQEHEVLRLGATRATPVDFRLVAAANANLRQMMDEGIFRSDLFYRLSVMPMVLPPLRDRREDIPLLVRHLASRLARREGASVPRFSAEAMMLLSTHDWPGNVRELENAVEQALVLCGGEEVGMQHVPDHLLSLEAAGSSVFDLPLKDARDKFEKQYLKEMLDRANGTVAEAARLAGINRQHFYEKMKRFEIERGV